MPFVSTRSLPMYMHSHSCIHTLLIAAFALAQLNTLLRHMQSHSCTNTLFIAPFEAGMMECKTPAGTFTHDRCWTSPSSRIIAKDIMAGRVVTQGCVSFMTACGGGSGGSSAYAWPQAYTQTHCGGMYMPKLVLHQCTNTSSTPSKGLAKDSSEATPSYSTHLPKQCHHDGHGLPLGPCLCMVRRLLLFFLFLPAPLL